MRAAILLIVLAILAAGCVGRSGEPATQSFSDGLSQQASVSEPTPEDLEGFDVPFIEGGETVEIGEML